MDAITTDEYDANHEQRIKTYRSRARKRQDLYTGDKLTFEMKRHAALCLNCCEWFWSTAEGKSCFEFCTDECRDTFGRKYERNRTPSKVKDAQVIAALRQLDEPSSPQMIAVVIMGFGEDWAHEAKHFDKTTSSSALRKTIKRLEHAGVLSQVGTVGRPKYLLC